MDKRPAIPVAIDGPNKTYTEYDMGRIRAGYVCIHCDEAQPEAFPEKCWICNFPIRDEQGRRFADEFEGYITLGPSRSIAEIRAEDDEAKARARYEREKPTSSIWLPSR